MTEHTAYRVLVICRGFYSSSFNSRVVIRVGQIDFVEVVETLVHCFEHLVLLVMAESSVVGF